MHCYGCRQELDHDEAFWTNPVTGKLETENGEPFCETCFEALPVPDEK